jgi:hypothetical protein
MLSAMDNHQQQNAEIIDAQPILIGAISAETMVPVVGGMIAFAAAGFLFQWMFEKLIATWEKRWENLESSYRGLSESVGRLPDQKDLALLQQQITEHEKSRVERDDLLKIEGRFEKMYEALQATQRLLVDQQKDTVSVRTEVARDYLRREDWIRFATTLETKIDRVHQLLEDNKK